MRKNILLLLLSWFISTSSFGQSLKEGNWKGIIHYDSIEVPFTFELKLTSNEKAEVIISNGNERIEIKNAKINGDSLFVPLGVFDSELRIKYIGNSMTGEWHKNYRSAKGPEFTATFNQPRFDKQSTVKSKSIQPKWNIRLRQPNGVESNAVGLFFQNRDHVTGTILTEVGDYRYFEGVVSKDSILMSSFDGVHAFLLTGKLQKDTWKGTLYYEPGYSESWVGTYDNEASIPDPFTLVTVEPGMFRPYYDILTAGGKYNSIDTDSLYGKVIIIQLMGTWCPNSLDQTHYLVEWAKSKPKDVKLLAVTYEPGNKEYAEKRIKNYKEMIGIPYSIYVGGSLSKGQAALAFPNMDRINAFPTLVIIDKQGYIRYIDSYFNGPATEEYYKQFDKEFNDRIISLLAE